MSSSPPTTSSSSMEHIKAEVLPEDYNQYDISFKMIVIGDAGVGKSCLTAQAAKGVFEESYSATVGFEFLVFNVKLNDKVVKLQIWDTCGQEMYRSLVQGFYRNTSLALVVYDISHKKSYDNLDIWIKDIRQHTEQDLPIFIAGNKSDLERNVPFEEAKVFALSNRTNHFSECSAKTGYNVKEIFFEAAKYLYKAYKEFQNQNKLPSSGRLKIGNDNDQALDKKKKKCC